MEDKKIVQLLFARAENAISELSTRFGKQLYRIAYNILENQLDAEECTNDTYFALWNAIPPVSPDPLAPYVYRTGRNTALKRLHRDTAKKRDSRYIFIRRYWFGDSVGEIARDLKMHENAVYVRLNRIRNSLKVYLKKEGEAGFGRL